MVSNTKKGIPSRKLVKPNSELEAQLSKLVEDKTPGRIGWSNDHKTEQTFYDQLSKSEMYSVFKDTSKRVDDAENLMDMFPDIELATQIITSLVMAPQDMVSSDLLFTSNSVLPTELKSTLLNKIKECLLDVYKLKEELPTIIREVLFDSGSYVKVVIPESSLDSIINSGQHVGSESIKDFYVDDNKIKSLGILGSNNIPNTNNVKGSVPGLEALDYTPHKIDGRLIHNNADFNIEVTDNFWLLNMPGIISKKVQANIHDIIATESYDNRGRTFKKGVTSVKSFVKVPTEEQTERDSVGRPMVRKIPSESVIPVYTPDDVENHLGYFILLDINGYPITRHTDKNILNSVEVGSSTANAGLTNLLTSKAKSTYKDLCKNGVSLQQASQIYSDLVESDILSRLKNGAYGSDLTLGSSSNIYKIMLSRSLGNRFTRLLYIPEELTTYFATKYHTNGVGKSLLDGLRILTSLRGILMFSKVIAELKNSIPITHVKVELDPNDPDPRQTIEKSVHEVAEMRQGMFPIGLNSPNDLVDWVQKAGLEFSFENHPKIASTKFDFETKNMQHTMPDNELMESFRKQTIMALGLSPETIDEGFAGKFATTVVANNVLLAKRVTQTQDIIMGQVTKYGKTITTNDMTLLNELTEIVEATLPTLTNFISDEELIKFKQDKVVYIEELLIEFIDSITIKLPRIDSNTLENQTENFNIYKSAIEDALEAWVSEDFINAEIATEADFDVTELVSTLKAYFLREWMAKHNYLPELNDMVLTNIDDKPVINLYTTMKNHVDGLAMSGAKYSKYIEQVKNKIKKKVSDTGAKKTPIPDEPK